MSDKKPQVVVVTGSSGGVGRAVAHAFAKRGARIGLLARGKEALDEVVAEVESFGGQALAVPTDVSDHAQIEAAAVAVEQRFGQIDVWVNDAMATVFAQFIHLEPEEFKRATEVTYLGTVYGTMVALSRMKPRDHGTIVQVGSALSYRAIPLQAAYCGAKFAIRGFTDSVRVELMHDKSNVDLTMVQLPGLNTTQFSWCRSKMPDHPQPVPPIYQPEIPAEAVYWAAQHHRREVWVGASAVWRSSATGSPRASRTATWPGPASRDSRCRTNRSAPTGPTTCSNHSPSSPARMGSLTTRPRLVAHRCGWRPIGRPFLGRWPGSRLPRRASSEPFDECRY